MLHLKTDPVGIDNKIQSIQTSLYNKLVASWNCEIEGYGRAYIDDDNGSIKPLVFKGNIDYEEVLTDDKINGAHFFFIEDNESDLMANTCLSTTDIDLILIVDDLRSVKADILHYADEEIKEEVKSYLNGFCRITKAVKGKDALDGFDISQLKFLYPYFVLKITATINNY